MGTTAAPRTGAATTLGLPGPSTGEMVRAFRRVRRDPLAFLGEVVERHGDLVAFPVPGAPALLVNDPAAARQVLRTSGRSWGKQTVQYAALARVTGPGLLASAEPTWIRHRRVAAGAFHHERLAAVSAEVAAAADEAVTERMRRVPEGTADVVDVAALAHRIALDAVGRALFSTDLSERSRLLLDATSAAASLVVRLGRSVLPLADRVPTPTTLRLRATRRRLDAVAADLVAERRARVARSATDDHGADLLGLLLDSGMPDGQVRDELVTMVVAGHETVAAALSWTLMLLAEHPQVQQRVREELAAHPGPVTMLDRSDELPFTRAVVDESLRLFPPAWALSRKAVEPDVVAGLELPAGSLAIISPWTLHRRPDAWPEPERFRPERFLGGVPAGSGYLPFGLGPRLCIGRDFALGEMLVVLDRLLAAAHVSLPDGWRRPAPEVGVAVHPRGGMPLVLRRRGTTG
ncbi:cytochrome P450 [Phycicoccus avicenniae]|uniref:cytochrome P450 n=1 Tax=Phycicoccus avicenniae TaxID=2828860 RepID=UPI003D2DAD99